MNLKTKTIAMIVKFNVPVIVFAEIQHEMTEQEYEEFKRKSLLEQAKFIVDISEQQGTGHFIDAKIIEGALDVGYATIKTEN